jgi:hypothetical protein
MLLALLALPPERTIPVYQGRNLYEWTAQAQRAQNRDYEPYEQDLAAAQKAIRALGTNALPWFLADLQARESLKDRALRWLDRRAVFLKLRRPSIANRWIRGIRGMEVLGPIAQPFLPELIALATNNMGYGPQALIAVGPAALPAWSNLAAHSQFPLTGNLIGALANAVYAGRIQPGEAALVVPILAGAFRSTDAHARRYAASALGAIHLNPSLCVPLLLEGLNDPQPIIRENCLQSLGAFGEDASPYAAKLADLFGQADANSRRTICGAMANFRSAHTVAVPLLVRGLADPDAQVRLWAAQSLGHLEGLATNALPALETACSDADPTVRQIATNAIHRIRGQP